MSNVSNVHSFVPFVSTGSNKSVALSGQRLMVLRYRKGKDGKEVQSMCASVPRIENVEIDSNLDSLRSHIINWLSTVQDEMGKSLYETGNAHVTTEQLEISKIAAFLTEQAAGERMTSDGIKEWFASDLQDILLVAFAEKMGIPEEPTEEQMKKLEQILAVYRDKFASLAGGRTMLPKDQREKLLKALELADCSDGIGQKLHAKLTAMANVSVEDMLGL